MRTPTTYPAAPFVVQYTTSLDHTSLVVGAAVRFAPLLALRVLQLELLPQLDEMECAFLLVHILVLLSRPAAKQQVMTTVKKPPLS